MTPRKPLALAGTAVLTAALALTACSSDDNDNKADGTSAVASTTGGGETSASAPTSGASQAPTTTTAPATKPLDPAKDPNISPADLPEIPADPTPVTGARKDVTFPAQCDTKLGDKKVDVTLKSSAKDKTDYLIVYSWVNGSDVMGRAVKLVPDVEPGQEVKVTLNGKLTKAANGCTENVRYGAFKAKVAELQAGKTAAPTSAAPTKTK